MNRAEILAKLRDNMVQTVILARRFTATKEAFDAACLAADGQEADRLRSEMHSVLDQQLDVDATSMTLSRTLMQSER